jgi:hypothetical protein
MFDHNDIAVLQKLLSCYRTYAEKAGNHTSPAVQEMIWRSQKAIDKLNDIVPMTRDAVAQRDPQFVHTWDWDTHPESHDGPCYCEECRFYGD